jgi:hypothetical protein
MEDATAMAPPSSGKRKKEDHYASSLMSLFVGAPTSA